MPVKKTVGVYERPPQRKWPRVAVISLVILIALALAAWWGTYGRSM